MRHLDLFSGIGGFALAASWAGMQTVAFVEKDDYCRRVLARHWPDVPQYGDIYEFDAKPFRGRIDIVTGGFPCQPFSVAGKQAGASDDRYLWPQMLRVITESRPAWVVAENVSGIINMALDDVLLSLEAEGYEAGTVVLPACSVGAPHIRSRVWILAHAASAGRETRSAYGLGDCEQAIGLHATHGGDATDAEGDGLQKREGQDDGGRIDAESKSGVDAARGSDVADANQPRLAQRESIAGNHEPQCAAIERDGCIDVANSESDGLERRQRQDRENDARGSGQSRLDVAGSCEAAPDADSEPERWPAIARRERGERELESRICRIPNELPEGMDGDINAKATKERPDKGVFILPETSTAKRNSWPPGRHDGVYESEVLRPEVYGASAQEGEGDFSRASQARNSVSGGHLSDMRGKDLSWNSSYRPEPVQQFAGKPDDLVRFMSHEMALGTWQARVEEAIGLHNLWQACAEIGHVPDALSTLQEIWQSLSDEEIGWIGLRIATGNPWCSEWPGVERVTSRVKDRVDRLRALGNAVVPQVVYPLMRWIKEIHEGRKQ